MLVIFEFNIIANCIVFEIIEKQWQLPKEVVNHQLPLKKRKLDLWYDWNVEPIEPVMQHPR